MLLSHAARMVRDALVMARAPKHAPHTTRRALAYAIILLVAGILGLLAWSSQSPQMPFNPPAWGIPVFAVVALACGLISQRSNQELTFTNHTMVVVCSMTVLYGPVIGAITSIIVGTIADIPKWRTMTRSENTMNAALDTWNAIFSSIAFLIAWNLLGGNLLVSAIATGVVSTVGNSLVLTPWVALSGSSMSEHFSAMRVYVPLSVVESMYVALGVAGAAFEPMLVIGLLVPPFLIRHGELHLEELERAREELMTDSLTGLFTRGYFWSQLEIRLVDQKLGGRTIGLVMCDIDNFKILNDTFGHVEGDRALIATANALKSVASAWENRAWAFRYGGEELSAIVLDPTPEELEQIAELMRTAAKDALLPWKTTLSIGYGTAGNDADAHAFVARIDRALYESKHAGKDRITWAAPITEPGSAAAHLKVA